MDRDRSALGPDEDGGSPDTAARAAAPASGGTSGLKRKAKTVLIVDDVSVMRLRMRPQIEEAGYRVLEAEDGERALDVIRIEGGKLDSGVDLVITDVTMPVMDGLELIRRLRQDPDFSAIPVIICTARGEISVVRRAKLLGVQGFLVKPISKPTLIASIRRELG